MAEVIFRCLFYDKILWGRVKSTRDGKQVRRRGGLPGPQLLLVPNHTARPGVGPPGCQARGSRSPPGHELIEHAEPGLRPPGPGPGPRPVFSAGPKRAPLKCVVPRSFDHFLKSRRHKVAKTDFERLVESAVTNLQVPRPASGCALRQLQSAAKRRCWGREGGLGRVTGTAGTASYSPGIGQGLGRARSQSP